VPALPQQAAPLQGSVVRRRILGMAAALRSYEPKDFAALFRLDQACFPAGISYSRSALRYFLSLRAADCLVAMDDARIAGFILTEENPPLAHVITLDVTEKLRRQGIGSALLAESEQNLALRGVRHVLLETAETNEAGVAFWQRHGYRIEATLKRYYLGRLDAYEMRKILPAPASQGVAGKRL
jgi:[ribosomal protein S18]-alanine N-acetyltransferase